MKQRCFCINGRKENTVSLLWHLIYFKIMNMQIFPKWQPSFTYYLRLLLLQQIFCLKFSNVWPKKITWHYPSLQTSDTNQTTQFPAGIYMPKVNNRNTRRRCEICSKLAIKIPERRHWFSYDKVVILIIYVFMSRKKQHLAKIVEIYKLSGPITSNYVYKRLKLPQRRM